MTSANANILLIIFGSVLALAGLLLMLSALFRDRTRGRRRCPKCWYDMSGVPGLTCPECGRAAKREAKLLKTRRRWRLAVVALLVVGAGIATAATPRALERGWRSLVPTAILLLFAPPTHPLTWVDSSGRTHEDPFAKELWRRFDQRGVPAWQWSMALHASGFLRSRPTWAVGEPFAVRVSLPEWLNAGSVELEPEGLDRPRQIEVSSVSARRSWQVIGYLTPGTTRVRVRATLRSGGLNLNTMLMSGGLSAPPAVAPFSFPGDAKVGELRYRGTFTLPVRAVPTLEESVTPVSGEAIDGLMRSLLSARVTWENSGSEYRSARLELKIDRNELGTYALIALPLVIGIVRDGKVVATMRDSLGMCEMVLPPGIDSCSVRLPASIRSGLEAPGAKSGWSIRIRGELGTMDQEWQRETYWKGEITIPMDEAIKD